MLGFPINGPLGNGVTAYRADNRSYPRFVHTYVGVVVDGGNGGFLVNEDVFGLLVQFKPFVGVGFNGGFFNQRIVRAVYGGKMSGGSGSVGFFRTERRCEKVSKE